MQKVFKGELKVAEFCLECWKKINEIEDDSIKFVLSRESDLCEECGEYKRVVIGERRRTFLYHLFKKPRAKKP